MLNRFFRLLSIATAISVFGAKVEAQLTFIVGGEAGYAIIESGTGYKQSVPVYGLTVMAILSGQSDKNFAVQLPFYIEIKDASKGAYTDLITGADLGFRFRNFSVGPGANYGLILRGDVEDSSCLNQPPDLSSTCLGGGQNGFRDIRPLNLLGVSGFGKLSFGPQGRAFIQARYIYYDKGLGYLLNRSDLQNLSNVDVGPLPPIPEFTDLPSFNGGRDIRLTAGYVFKRLFLRAQYTDRKIEFSRERANLNGAFDQKTRQLTAGVGIVL
jgi:hypothetical protein